MSTVTINNETVWSICRIEAGLRLSLTEEIILSTGAKLYHSGGGWYLRSYHYEKADISVYMALPRMGM